MNIFFQAFIASALTLFVGVGGANSAVGQPFGEFSLTDIRTLGNVKVDSRTPLFISFVTNIILTVLSGKYTLNLTVPEL